MYSVAEKNASNNSGSLSLGLKIGEYELEIGGTHLEVMETVENLPDLVANVIKAFECTKPKAIVTTCLR